jgi:hypothetical protein
VIGRLEFNAIGAEFCPSVPRDTLAAMRFRALALASGLSLTGCSILVDLSVLQGDNPADGGDAGQADAPHDGPGDAGPADASAETAPVDPHCPSFDAGSPLCFGMTCQSPNTCFVTTTGAICEQGGAGYSLNCGASSDCAGGSNGDSCCMHTFVDGGLGLDASSCPLVFTLTHSVSAQCGFSCAAGDVMLCGNTSECAAGQHCEKASILGKPIGICMPL